MVTKIVISSKNSRLSFEHFFDPEDDVKKSDNLSNEDSDSAKNAL